MKRLYKAFGAVGSAAALLALGCVAGAQQSPPPPYSSAQYAAPGQPYTTVWPLRLDGSEGLIEVYQPQPEQFQGDSLTARAAVSLTPPGATAPVFGAMWMNARVATDRDARTVTIQDVQIRRVKFPDTSDQQQQQFAQILENEIPRLNVTFSLDQLMTSLDVAQQEKSAVAQLQTTPPRIIFTTTPSTLVLIDGQPQLQPVETPRVMRVVNTPFIVLMDMDSKRYFLKAGEIWFTASAVPGPWARVAAVPPSIADAGSKLTGPPAQTDPNAPPPPPGPAPVQVIVAFEPTELISSDGPPAYTPLPGNDLLYMTNTQSDVFMEVATQQYYVLLAGRWYKAGSLQGPWAYVQSDQLPPVFANIPADSPKAHVLASVAGTVDAREARLEANIPQTAVIARDSGSSLSVSYDGSPQFESIQQSPVSYAVNCSDPVFAVSNRFYCCHQAVWYESPVAAGPWAVCVSVPQAIYTIPPSCPYYYVRYCYVYHYTPDVVYCGYLPGYTGCYVFGPTVVYGTGYYYRGWYRHEYYPRFHTWGVGARYDVHYATWADGAPYRWDRDWFVRGSERHDWWGPRGYTNYRHLDNVRETRVNNVTNIRNVTNVRNVNVNIYNRTENVRRNVSVNHNAEVRNEARPNAQAPRQAGGRNAPAPHAYAPPTARAAGTYENNIYAGHDGQVYRRTQTGWEQRNPKGWQKLNSVPEGAPARNPTGTPGRAQPQSPPARAERQNEPPPSRAARTPEPAPSRAERPSNQPQRSAPPANREPSPARQAPRQAAGNPGLEADHVARQRGVERSRGSGGSPAPSRGAERPSSPPPSRGGGPSGGAPPSRGGGSPGAGSSANQGGNQGGQQQNRR